MYRPSGEGIAQPTYILVCSQTGRALPCRSTLSIAWTPVFVEALTHRRLPSAVQSRELIEDQSFREMFLSLPSLSVSRRITGCVSMSRLLSLAIARVNPSGERVQLKE